jgi:hypothetical protein
MNSIPTLSLYQSAPVATVPPPIQFPNPLSYDFQVVEHVDDAGTITKVALQVKVNYHDQYGNIATHGTWNDVPRVQLKF